MTSFRARLGAVLASVVALAATSCIPFDVYVLSGDPMGGRDAGTASGNAARDYILDRIVPLGDGPLPAAAERDRYQQPFSGGTNVLALFPGTEHPDQVVMVGAHYDGLGGCGDPYIDLVCNGATDNATGVAVLLDLAWRLHHDPPERSVMLAFWDAEEDGLAGSEHYAANPVVPMSHLVAYVNVDLVGSNLLPSLTNTTFAVGAESGGPALVDAVDTAIGATTLDVSQLSMIFGAGRSDHVAFVENQVPTVFFSDSTGGCYHMAGDEFATVDFGKLMKQNLDVDRTVRALSDGGVTPEFTTTPLVTYDDLLGLLAVVERSSGDLDLFPADAQADIARARAQLEQIRDDGRAAFGSDDMATLLVSALSFVDYLAALPCDGYVTE